MKLSLLKEAVIHNKSMCRICGSSIQGKWGHVGMGSLLAHADLSCFFFVCFVFLGLLLCFFLYFIYLYVYFVFGCAGSSLLAHVPCTGRQILIHSTTRGVPELGFERKGWRGEGKGGVS